MGNIELAEMARNKGICKEGFERIANVSTMEELLHYYIEGIDFCLEHNFPSKEYLKKHGDDKLEDFGIHVDGDLTERNARNTVLLGNCSASLIYDSYSVSQLFIKHDSQVKVVVKDSAYLVIDCFDNTVVNILASGSSKVLVNVYGNALVEISEHNASQIKVVKKRVKSYV